MQRQHLAALLAGLLAAGCAAQKAAEDTANLSAQFVNQYRSNVEAFVRSANDSNAAYASRLATMRLERQRREALVATRIAAWNLANNQDALAMQKAINTVTPDSILLLSSDLASLKPSAKPEQVPALDTKQFDAVVKQLKAMGEPPSLGQQIESLGKFAAETHAAYDATLEKAAEAKTKAAAADKAKAKAAAAAADKGKAEDEAR